MSEFPSLPLFTDAFIADTGHLSATETGAYLMLLMMAWRLPDCRIPDDDAKLARWARVDARAWSRIKSKVMEFWTLEDGHWTQKRLLLERDKVRKFADTARTNGMRGGRPKSLKSQERQNPAGSPSETQSKAPNPNPNPNPIEEDALSLRSRAARATSAPARIEPDPGFSDPEPEPQRASAPVIPLPRAPPGRATRLPPDWAPSPAAVTLAHQEGLSDEQLGRELARFRDYWRSAGGANARKVDWDAAFRNWLRKAADGLGNTRGYAAGRGGAADDSHIGAARRAAARFADADNVPERWSDLYAR